MTKKRLGLLVLVGCCCLSGSNLWAQTPAQFYGSPEVVVVSGGGDGAPAARPGHALFNSHGLCCNGDLNQMGCRNCRSYMTFIFGSCRTFFGEPCEPKPPHFGAHAATRSGAATGGAVTNAGQNCCGN